MCRAEIVGYNVEPLQLTSKQQQHFTVDVVQSERAGIHKPQTCLLHLQQCLVDLTLGSAKLTYTYRLHALNHSIQTFQTHTAVWWHGKHVASGWVTVFGQVNHLSIYSTTQINSAFHPASVGKSSIGLPGWG